MTCRHCQPLLSPYLDRALSSEEHQKVLSHLTQCLTCTKQLQQLEENRQLIRMLPAVEIPQELEARLLSKVQSRQSTIRHPPSAIHRWWHEWPMLSFGTVATCAASLLFYFAMMQAPSKVSAEEVVSSMDQLIGTLDPDEGERAIAEETPDEAIPEWSNEIESDLFENENEQD
ncbi:MAG: hypothetical protein FJ147_02890 [Deltaproteobacteria bacterium]|nr:hypothetical protein [Deltaproteobacteria bacterium]